MRTRRALAGLVAGALVLVMWPAMATGNSYTVAVGGSATSGSHAISASSVASLTWRNERPDGAFLTMSCSSMSAPAATSSVSSGAEVVDIARFAGVTLQSCVMPMGALAVTTSGTWTMHATGAATAATTDVVPVHLSNVSIRWANAVCQFTAVGGLDGRFDEATQRLEINELADGTGEAFTVTGVRGCLGQFKNNGKAQLIGSLQIASPDGPINLR